VIKKRSKARARAREISRKILQEFPREFNDPAKNVSPTYAVEKLIIKEI
jgi:hypothetical protein